MQWMREGYLGQRLRDDGGPYKGAPFFSPYGLTRLAILVTLIVCTWVAGRAIKYWFWADLLGVTVPGYNS